MRQQTTFCLGILLIVQIFLAGVLGLPGLNYIVNPDANLIMPNELKKSASSSYHHTVVMTEAETVTVQLATIQPVMVTVTVTTIVKTVTVDPDAMNSTTTANASDRSIDNQPFPATIINTTVLVTASASSPGSVSTASTDTLEVTAMTVTLVTTTPVTSWPPTSTPFLSSPSTNVGNTTTFATITLAASAQVPTSSFNEAVCDDIFCNTDGRRVCIYWAGYTSWDVSLGPIPGEIPTVIGTCFDTATETASDMAQ